MLNDLTSIRLREMNRELKSDMMIVLSEKLIIEEMERIALKWKQAAKLQEGEG